MVLVETVVVVVVLATLVAAAAAVVVIVLAVTEGLPVTRHDRQIGIMVA